MAQSAHLHQDSTEDHAPGAPPQQEAHHELEGESIHSNASIDIQPQDKDSTTLSHIPTHASHTHDAAIQHHSSHVEIPDEVYDRLPPSRKMVIVALLSFCSFLAPISSTTVLAAVPEVAATYNTDGDIINVSNALYLIFMGISPCFWGPLSQVYGRRIVRHFSFLPQNIFDSAEGECLLLQYLSLFPFQCICRTIPMISFLDLHLDCLLLHGLQCWHCSFSKPGRVLHLPDAHCPGRHVLLEHWRLLHR